MSVFWQGLIAGFVAGVVVQTLNHVFTMRRIARELRKIREGP